jgi:hypothetical protein
MKIELLQPVKHLERTVQAFTCLDRKNRNATYLEIGAHRGRSIGTIGHVLKDFCQNLHIIGYDIFGSENTEFHIKEDNGKGGGNIVKCRRNLDKLKSRNPHVTYELIEGYTTNTLQYRKADWTYIDGGHSYETVKWDHSQLKDSDVIIFDDSDLEGVNRYLWEIKDQYEIFDLHHSPGGSRQSIIINDRENFDLDSAGLSPFGGVDPLQWKAIR